MLKKYGETLLGVLQFQLQSYIFYFEEIPVRLELDHIPYSNVSGPNRKLRQKAKEVG